MTTNESHPHDALQELLDGRVDARTRVEVEAHLAACPECRHELEVIRWAKRIAVSAGASASAPADLESRIRQALDREERGSASSWARVRPRARALVAAAAEMQTA